MLLAFFILLKIGLLSQVKAISYLYSLMSIKDLNKQYSIKLVSENLE
jgi:hypothetical protein